MHTTLIFLQGINKDAIYEKFTDAFIFQRASVSTLPFGIDDPAEKPSKGSNLNDVVVDLYNRGKTCSLRKGSASPKSIPLVATNYSLHQEERCVYNIHIIVPGMCIACPSTLYVMIRSTNSTQSILQSVCSTIQETINLPTYG